MPIYLDYAATTPIDPDVFEAMLPFLKDDFANPASLHQMGQKSRKAVENAREQVANAIGANSKEIIFNAGATESINHVLQSIAHKYPNKKIISSQLEHAATISTLNSLAANGHEVVFLSPDQNAAISPEALLKEIDNNTALVSLMLVNNETGAITDIAKISEIAKSFGALVFSDAVQAFGLQDLNVNKLGVDFLALSGHKIYGPKGVGVLYIRDGLEIDSFVKGGKQERGLRAGTLNTAAIVAMGKASELATKDLEINYKHLSKIQKQFEKELLENILDIEINALNTERSPKQTNIWVKGIDGEALLFTLDLLGVYASAGSACSAGSLEPSHVLTAMGLSKDQAKASIRFSFGKYTFDKETHKAALLFKEAVERCRKFA